MVKKFRSFEKAREFARTLGLNGQKEWENFCKLGKRSSDIPSNPQITYKNKGWKGWGLFRYWKNCKSKEKISSF